MLQNPIQPSMLIDECTIIQVDPIRCLCKVKTLRGQILSQVRWLVPFGGSSRAGDRFSPHMGDRAVVQHGLGNPIIIGFVPRLQASDGSTPLSISSGDTSIDTGNYSADATVVIPDQNKPKDLVQGDRLFSTSGGALLGLLRGGSVLIRSSRVAEIFMTKYSSLVRIVSRNWEHFTDVCSDVVKNFNGRIYRYTGYSRDFVEAKNEDYRLNFFYGDVGAAEAVKTSYHTYTGTPPTNDLLYKEQVIGAQNSESPPTSQLMYRTLSVQGHEEVWVGNGADFTRITTTPDTLRLSLNDEDIIEIVNSQIRLIRADGATVILNSDGINAEFQGGSVEITADNVVVTKGTSTATVSDSEVALENGSHFCRVNSGGVQLG